MEMGIYIALVINVIMLVLVASMTPLRSQRSQFAREQRRAKAATAPLDVQREQFLLDLLSLQRVIVSIGLVGVVALSVAAFGWLLGLVFAVVVATVYGRLARLSLVARIGQQLYRRFEPVLIGCAERHQVWFRYIRTASVDMSPVTPIASRSEFDHVVEQLGSTVVSPDERAQLQHGLQFGARRVADVMTTRDDIPHIDSKELLGPLVLDDLHKTNHHRFVVTDGDLDHAVGVLDIQTMLRLDVKRSVTAAKAMDPRVLYIHQDQPLEQALAVCLETHQSLLVAVDDAGLTTGVVRLDDLVQALTGREVQRPGDSHETAKSAARATRSATTRAKKSATR